MRTILVDAWNTFITENGINIEMQKLLDTFVNNKIILTNANFEEMQKLWIINMPYEVFSLEHNPNKTDWFYYEIMLNKFWLDKSNVIYFEHNIEAVAKAKEAWINTYYYNKDKKDLVSLENFLKNNL